MTLGIQKIFDNPNALGVVQEFLSPEGRSVLGATCYQMAREDPIISRRFNPRPKVGADPCTVSNIGCLWAKSAFQKNPYQGPLLPAILPILPRSSEIPILGSTRILATPITSTASPEGITDFQNSPIKSDEQILSLADELRDKQAALEALPMITEEELEDLRTIFRAAHLDEIESRILRHIAARTAERRPIIERIKVILFHLNKVRDYTFFRFNQKIIDKFIVPHVTLPTSSLLLKRYSFPRGVTPRHIIYIYDVLLKELSSKWGPSRPTVLDRNVSYADAKMKIPELISSHYNLKFSIKKTECGTTYLVKVTETSTGAVTQFNTNSHLGMPFVVFCNAKYLIFSNGTIYHQETKKVYLIDPLVIRNYFPCGDLDTSVIDDTLILSRGSGVDVIDLLSGKLISSITLPSFLGKSIEIINIRMDQEKGQIHIAAQADKYARTFIYGSKNVSRFETASVAMRDLLYIDPSIDQIRNIPSDLAKSIQKTTAALRGRASFVILTHLFDFISRFIPAVFIELDEPLIQPNLLPNGVLTPLVKTLVELRTRLLRVFEASNWPQSIFLIPFNIIILLIISPSAIITGLLGTFLCTLFYLRPGTGKLINAINMGFKSLDTRILRSINNESSHSVHLANFIAIAATTSRVALLAIQGFVNFISTTIFTVTLVTINTYFTACGAIALLFVSLGILGILGITSLIRRRDNNL